MPKLNGIVNFDPEAGMFYTYSSEPEAVKVFSHSFKEACENLQICFYVQNWIKNMLKIKKPVKNFHRFFLLLFIIFRL